MSTNSDKAIEILRNTNDGDDLSPEHLSLLEDAVNGYLNEKGEEFFAQLHAQVTSLEGYKKPWFHGIEHLTIDVEGYVYWKGHEVEHYSFPWRKKANQAAHELAARCRHLERIGVPVSCTTAIWNWEKYQNQTL